MEQLTYQQVLADTYEETAKSMLVFQREYEEEEGPPPDDKHPDELENQDDFNEFKGSRQMVEVPKEPPKYDDKTTQGVRYNKDVQTRVINIDSRFRTDYTDTETNFLYKLLTPVKNVVSVRLSSVEIPNTYYNFSAVKGNIWVTIQFTNGPYVSAGLKTLYIPDGNYTIGDPNIYTGVENIVITLANILNQYFAPAIPFIVNFNTITSKVEISTSPGNEFILDFSINSPFISRQYDWGLGYNLGFREKTYSGSFIYQAEGVADMVGPNYLFVSLYPDWKVVTHNHPDKSQFGPFGKIIVSVPKNDVIYDNGANTVTKEYWLQQPTTVSSFQILVTDPYEEPIDLVGANLSLTVELKEIMNPALYEHIRQV
jgi:hypothetical protein